jgi:hypothetical protein
MSGDTLTINNGATVTVNTSQNKFWNTIAITNGKLLITNSSTTTPIRFGMGRLSAGTAAHTITPANGLGSVEVTGDWIEIGTSDGTDDQTFTSPYATGDYIPALWVETASGSGQYEMWTNVTNARSFDIFNYTRSGFRAVGSGNGGKCFTQDANRSAVQYINLASCNTKGGSNVITCTSTTGLVPGTWLTGRGLPSVAIVEKIIDSTTFTIHAAVAAANGQTGMPIIGILPVCSQYTTTLRFGDGVNGTVPPNGAKIRIPNILLTDYTPAIFAPTSISATNTPCKFVGTNGGLFSFNTCLFGESASNYTQAGSLSLTDVGFCYVPFVSECYQLTINRMACGLPPLVQYPGQPTALGATGSTNSTTTVTTPATNAIIPGVLLTGTNLHACTVTTVNSSTQVIVSTAAFGTGGSIAFSYYGNWTVRDMRYQLSTTLGEAAHFSAVQWSYITGASITDLVITFGGGAASGSNTNQGLAGATVAPFSTQYSDGITVNGLKAIQVGSYPRTRPFQTLVSTSISGNTQTFSNVEAYNMSGVLAASAVSNVTMSNVTHRPGINNEGYNWSAGYRAFTNPATAAELALDTKYWFKSRAYRTHDFDETTGYIDSPVVCGVLAAPDRHKHTPRYFGASPAFTTTLAPTLATNGSGTWVGLGGTASQPVAIVSEDNGATWTSYMMPSAPAIPWWKVIWSPTDGYFVAITGTVATTTFAYSINGKEWAAITTAPGSSIWQAIAYDGSQATNKWVAVSGGSAASTAGTRLTITNGSIVATGTTLASAQWIDVTSNGAGRYVAIAGGNAAGTATSYSTDGATWTAGGANASSQWVSIAYGSGRFVCVSASATNGPTAYSTDAVAWTAGTAPTLPTGMNYNKIIWTGSVFVLLAGPAPLTVAAPAGASASQCYATSADGITWSALKYLPDFTFWASCTNNGNAVMFISTQTGRVAYTPDITAGTPTWNLYTTGIPVWNKVYWYSQAPEYNPTAPTLTSVATTINSSTVTCASTAGLYVGAVITFNGVSTGAAYLGTGAFGTQTNAAIVTGITNSTTFTINKNALKTASGLTATFYKHSYLLYRSTSAGFTERDNTTLIGATTGVGSTGAFNFDDSLGVTKDTTYYYRLVKQSGYATLANCSGTSGVATITTSGSFYNWRTSTEMEGLSGTNTLFTRVNAASFYLLGIVPGCIVTGTGIPAGTTVSSVDDFNQITLSANLTSDVNARGASRTTVTFSPAPGMRIYGSNVGLNSEVVSVDSATSMTVSVANTNTFTNQTLTFVDYLEMPEFACIPQTPVVVQNNALQSNTLANASWTKSSVTATDAQALAPTQIFVGLNGAAPTGTAASLRATAANGTVTQAVNTGVGSTYTFSVFARADIPDNRDYITMKLDLGTTTQTFTLSPRWTRYSVNFTATANTTNAVITIPQMGSLIYVQDAMVTLGTSVPVPITATTTVPGYLFPQHNWFTTAPGVVGYAIDGGAGIEQSFAAVPAGTTFSHLHLGTASNFTLSDQNQLFSTEAAGGTAETLVGTAASATNIRVDNLDPANDAVVNHGTLLYAASGSTNITVSNSRYAINGTTQILYLIPAATPAYNIYLYNIDALNIRPYVAAIYQDGATANSSRTITLQNIRSNKTSRFAWSGQSLDTIWKSAPGCNPYPVYNGTSWNLNTAVTQDSVPLANIAVYDSMFHEFTYETGASVQGALHLRMTPSAKATKPYTVISGTPFFSNRGELFFRAPGDQLVIEWPHFIKGVTGFDKRLPHVYGTDVGLDLVTSLGVLVEYDLDKGSGYSGSWKRLTANINNLATETGIDPSVGVRPKFRLTARQGLKYTGQSSQFVVGETIYNANTIPAATASFVVDEDEVSGAATTGTLIVSSVTGVWGTANTMYSSAGATRATITATNADVFFPQPTSNIAGIRLFTLNDNVDQDNLYPYSRPFINITGLQAGSEVRIFRTSDSFEIAGIESSGTSFSAQYDYYADTNVYVVVHSLGYRTIRLNNQVLGANGYSLLVQQELDRWYSNT